MTSKAGHTFTAGARSVAAILASIKRQTAHFYDDDADATPRDVVAVANTAAELEPHLAALLNAARRVLAWSDRQPRKGLHIPDDAANELRAAIAKAEGGANV